MFFFRIIDFVLVWSFFLMGQIFAPTSAKIWIYLYLCVLCSVQCSIDNVRLLLLNVNGKKQTICFKCMHMYAGVRYSRTRQCMYISNPSNRRCKIVKLYSWNANVCTPVIIIYSSKRFQMVFIWMSIMFALYWNKKKWTLPLL